eukprot:TRINITY_DN20381_c0_g1_i2.p1 TRINITY_DN20381_c0_g1~~TRINITY_DN20381_c0_g1_i2.p1  ORF type:complete len:261 (-),score=44.17 TRINITY_DN20381_c0_g1_i2:46-828(-)
MCIRDRSFSNIFDRLIKLDSNGDVVRILAFEEAENVTLQRGSDESPDIAVWTATLGFSRDGETQIRERVLIEFKLFSEEIDEYVESNYLLGADQFITVQGNSIFFSITLEDFGQGDIFEKVELNIDMLYNKTEFDTDDEIVPNSLDDIDFVELVAEDTFSAVKTIFQIPEVLDPTISFASDRQLLLTMTLDCNDQDCFDSFEAFVEYELSKSLDFLECDDAPLAVQIALPIFVLTVLFISLLILTIVYIILRKVREVNPD